MRWISMGHDRLRTEDEVAEAVVAYAAALARSASADVVDVPVLGGDGRTERALLLLGPASQLAVLPAPEAESRLVGATAAIDELRLRIELLEPTAHPSTKIDPASSFPDFGDYA